MAGDGFLVMEMKIYHGIRTSEGCTVTAGEVPLDERLELRQYSASGFEWGYEGSGPRQLALAILADHFGDGARALSQCQLFMEVVTAELKGDEWKLTGEQIDNAFSQVVQVPFDLETLLNKVRGLE